MEFAWLFKARRFFPLFVLLRLYTVHFPFQRSFSQRFHGHACSQSSRCLLLALHIWFSLVCWRSEVTWCLIPPRFMPNCDLWLALLMVLFNRLLLRAYSMGCFFSDMMSPSLLMVPILIDADWLILFWWVGIIFSWIISSTNDDSDPKLGTVSHYFPLAWDHDSKWMYCCVFALTGGVRVPTFWDAERSWPPPGEFQHVPQGLHHLLAFANNLQERTWVFKLHMWWRVWVQELMFFALVVNVLFSRPFVSVEFWSWLSCVRCILCGPKASGELEEDIAW